MLKKNGIQLKDLVLPFWGIYPHSVDSTWRMILMWLSESQLYLVEGDKVDLRYFLQDGAFSFLEVQDDERGCRQRLCRAAFVWWFGMEQVLVPGGKQQGRQLMMACSEPKPKTPVFRIPSGPPPATNFSQILMGGPFIIQNHALWLGAHVQNLSVRSLNHQTSFLVLNPVPGIFA